MTLADIAKITIDPKGLFKSRWIHDTAHAIVRAKRRLLGETPETDPPPGPR